MNRRPCAHTDSRLWFCHEWRPFGMHDLDSCYRPQDPSPPFLYSGILERFLLVLEVSCGNAKYDRVWQNSGSQCLALLNPKCNSLGSGVVAFYPVMTLTYIRTDSSSGLQDQSLLSNYLTLLCWRCNSGGFLHVWIVVSKVDLEYQWE